LKFSFYILKPFLKIVSSSTRDIAVEEVNVGRIHSQSENRPEEVESIVKAL